MTSIQRKRKVESTKMPVQVAVRIRPTNDAERSDGIIVSKSSKTTLNCKNKAYGPFDYVYSPEASQETIFEDIVQPQISKVIDGFNCTIFAYGQTGTGKTYTMEGGNKNAKSSRDDPSTGVTPRAVEEIFKQLGDKGLEEYSIRISYVELYNEELYDLLTTCTERPRLRLFDDPARKGNVIVSGAEEVPVRSREEVYELLSRGANVRATAETQMNDKSSRSHSIFTIHVTIREYNEKDEELVKMGKLYLVDLAGSENIGKSGVEGKRAKEAGNINQSLLTLGRVIESLVTNKQHIPYRESKLTRLLQDSLGGSTITCIISTVSPGATNFEETTSTLQYAMRALNIKNNPECNMQVTRKEMMKQYNGEIEKLKRDLRAARDKKGVFISNESLEDLEKTAQVERQLREELQDKMEVMLIQMQRFAEDMDEMNHHYRLVYNRQNRLHDKLKLRVDELDAVKQELEDTRSHLQAYTSAAGELKASVNISNRQLVDVVDAWKKLKYDLQQWWLVHEDAISVTNCNECNISTAANKINKLMDDSRSLIDAHISEMEKRLSSHCDSADACSLTINSFLEAARANQGNTRLLVNKATSEISDLMKRAQDDAKNAIDSQNSSLALQMTGLTKVIHSHGERVAEMVLSLKSDAMRSGEVIEDQANNLSAAKGNLSELASMLRSDANKRTEQSSQDVQKFDNINDQLQSVMSIVQKLSEEVAELKQSRSDEDTRQIQSTEDRVNATESSVQTIDVASSTVKAQFSGIMSSCVSCADEINEVIGTSRITVVECSTLMSSGNSKFEEDTMQVISSACTSCSTIATAMAEDVEKEMQISNGTLDQLEATTSDMVEDARDLKTANVELSTKLVENLEGRISEVEECAKAAMSLKRLNSDMAPKKMIESIDENIPEAPKMKVLLEQFGYYNKTNDAKRIRESLLDNVDKIASPGTLIKRSRLGDIQEMEMDKENVDE